MKKLLDIEYARKMTEEANTYLKQVEAIVGRLNLCIKHAAITANRSIEFKFSEDKKAREITHYLRLAGYTVVQKGMENFIETGEVTDSDTYIISW